MIEGLIGAVASPDDFAGDADDGAVFGDGMDNNAACADAGAVADVNVAENFRAAADDNVVAKGGMALAGFLPGAAKRDALIQEAVIPDFSGFADNDAHAVIDEKTASDGRAGMDFNAGYPAGGLGNEARDEGDASPVKRVGEAMKKDGVETWITQQNLDNALRGGVLAEDRVDLFLDRSEHAVTPIM